MKYYLTTPIYYVNAAPHIGHTYTTIAAETIARFKRMQGYDAVLSTGTDEHGQKVERAAEAAGKTPQEFTDVDLRRIPRAVGEARHPRRPLPPHHRPAASQGGAGSVPALPGQRLHLQGQLHRPVLRLRRTLRQRRQARRSVPRLRPPHRDRHRRELLLQALGVSRTSCSSSTRRSPISSSPRRAATKCSPSCRQGLNDLSISRTTIKWGIPLPVEGKHVFYVWFDALITYMSAVDGEGPVARRPAPDRQGDRALPRRLLARVPDGGRACRCPSASSPTAGCCSRTTR